VPRRPDREPGIHLGKKHRALVPAFEMGGN
jgi:hypothetical protein